jgi:hypothetical protein
LNPAVIYLAILIIWPSDNSAPTMAHALAPTMAVCQASIAAEKVTLEARPEVRFVAATCFEFDRGEKS